jgi:hypothetical protein
MSEGEKLIPINIEDEMKSAISIIRRNCIKSTQMLEMVWNQYIRVLMECMI